MMQKVKDLLGFLASAAFLLALAWLYVTLFFGGASNYADVWAH